MAKAIITSAFFNPKGLTTNFILSRLSYLSAVGTIFYGCPFSVSAISYQLSAKKGNRKQIISVYLLKAMNPEALNHELSKK
jgi:hypothetical protein